MVTIFLIGSAEPTRITGWISPGRVEANTIQESNLEHVYFFRAALNLSWCCFKKSLSAWQS